MSPQSLAISAVIMAVAAALITTAWRLSRRNNAPCFEDYAFYILFFYLMTFANQIIPAVVWDVTWWEYATIDRMFWVLQVCLGLPLALATLYFFVRFVFGLSGRIPPKKFVLYFAAAGTGLVVFAGLYIIGFFRPERFWETRRIFDGLRMVVPAVLVFFPMMAAFRARLYADARRVRSVRGFALIQAASIVAFEATILAHPPELVHDILRSLFNIPPLLFLAVRASTLVPPIFAGFEFDNDAAALFDRRGITPRERDIVRLVCRGRTNREIEESLFISLDTVKRHLTHIYRKLGIRNRAELVALFIRPGMTSAETESRTISSRTEKQIP